MYPAVDSVPRNITLNVLDTVYDPPPGVVFARKRWARTAVNEETVVISLIVDIHRISGHNSWSPTTRKMANKSCWVLDDSPRKKASGSLHSVWWFQILR